MPPPTIEILHRILCAAIDRRKYETGAAVPMTFAFSLRYLFIYLRSPSSRKCVHARARARTRILHSLNSRVRKRFTCYLAMCTVNCMKLVAFLFVALFSLIPNLRLFAMPCMPSIFVSVCVAVHSFIH